MNLRNKNQCVHALQLVSLLSTPETIFPKENAIVIGSCNISSHHQQCSADMVHNFFSYINGTKSCGATVCIATGYGLDTRGVGFCVPLGSRKFTSPYLPDRF
jgi:hypothetical protein